MLLHALALLFERVRKRGDEKRDRGREGGRADDQTWAPIIAEKKRLYVAMVLVVIY